MDGVRIILLAVETTVQLIIRKHLQDLRDQNIIPFAVDVSLIAINVEVLALGASDRNQGGENIVDFGTAADVDQVLPDLDRLGIDLRIIIVVQPIQINGTILIASTPEPTEGIRQLIECALAVLPAAGAISVIVVRLHLLRLRYGRRIRAGHLTEHELLIRHIIGHLGIMIGEQGADVRESIRLLAARFWDTFHLAVDQERKITFAMDFLVPRHMPGLNSQYTPTENGIAVIYDAEDGLHLPDRFIIQVADVHGEFETAGLPHFHLYFGVDQAIVLIALHRDRVHQSLVCDVLACPRIIILDVNVKHL